MSNIPHFHGGHEMVGFKVFTLHWGCDLDMDCYLVFDLLQHTRYCIFLDVYKSTKHTTQR